MKKFCQIITEHAVKKIVDEKNELTQLAPKECKSYLNQAQYSICRKEIQDIYNINYNGFRDHCHYTGNNQRYFLSEMR